MLVFVLSIRVYAIPLKVKGKKLYAMFQADLGMGFNRSCKYRIYSHCIYSSRSFSLRLNYR